MACEDLTSEQWARPEPLLPVGKKPRRPPVRSKRRLINGIRRRTRTGAPWRDDPAHHGEWETVYGLFRRGSATAPGAGASPSCRPGPTREV
ncbi:transposase [Streptomyces sp. 1114.5]|uniref:transposase n=1 Tax=Streptomyces sp. 1114.5 TaxID=1938830 RepID=UPI001602AB0A|nr:transposase [Streptomyces sp. 1114.5]